MPQLLLLLPHHLHVGAPRRHLVRQRLHLLVRIHQLIEHLLLLDGHLLHHLERLLGRLLRAATLATLHRQRHRRLRLPSPRARQPIPLVVELRLSFLKRRLQLARSLLVRLCLLLGVSSLAQLVSRMQRACRRLQLRRRLCLGRLLELVAHRHHLRAGRHPGLLGHRRRR